MLKDYLKLMLFFGLMCTHSHFLYANQLNTQDNYKAVNQATTEEQTLSPLKWLQQMQKAQQSQDYEMSFIHLDMNEIKSLRYSHFSLDKKNYAQLITLEGSPQEIIQVNDLIGYFQANYPAFSLQGSHVVDYLPSILWADLKQLSDNYDIVNIGFNRVADRLVQTFRVLPKDDFRYQYVVFIDTETHLLLRSDILDRKGNLLEQYLVVNLNLNKNFEAILPDFVGIKFPPLLKNSSPKNLTFHWKPMWLPKGFKLINQSEQNSNDTKIETQIYSDGLFSFSLHHSNKFIPNEHEKGWKQGMLTLYTMNKGNREFTFTGQLPILSAKRILEDIKVN